MKRPTPLELSRKLEDDEQMKRLAAWRRKERRNPCLANVLLLLLCGVLLALPFALVWAGVL